MIPSGKSQRLMATYQYKENGIIIAQKLKAAGGAVNTALVMAIIRMVGCKAQIYPYAKIIR